MKRISVQAYCPKCGQKVEGFAIIESVSNLGQSLHVNLSKAIITHACVPTPQDK